jgi:hypothetical protein
MKVLKTVSAWFEAWFAWLPATGVTWAVSLVLAVLIVAAVGPALPQEASLALAGLAGGALIGLAQWLLLNPGVRGAGVWILTTAVGWVASLALVALVVTGLGHIWGRLAGGVLGGLVLGGMQWLALRPEAKRVQWLLMTVSGWTAAVALSLVLPSWGWGMFREAILYVAVSGTVGLVLIGIVAVFGRVLLFPDFGQKDRTSYVKWWW